LDARGQISFFGAFANVLKGGAFSARFNATYRPEISGEYEFGLMSGGLARAYIDDTEVIDNWSSQTPGDSFYSFGSTEKRVKVQLEAGQAYELRIDFLRPETQIVPGIQIGVVPPTPPDLIDRAAQAATEADATILVVGTNSDWETEGNDRQDMSLPGRQLELIEAVLKADPNTIVVMNAGSPVDMPWLNQARGLIYTWFGGQESGRGLADILFGTTNPSGRLPSTFPVCLEDTPAFTSYPGELGQVHYGEGLFAGYRWYDKRNIAPLFPFGYGLSYSEFSYGELQVAEEIPVGEDVTLTVNVSNNSDRAGQEVVQLYVGQEAPSLTRPIKELKGFEKIHLDAGETKSVTLTLNKRAFSYWHPGLQDWVCEPGQYVLSIGASATDIRQQKSLNLV
jgi:beta-glucosidase